MSSDREEEPAGADGLLAAHVALTLGMFAKFRERGLISNEDISDVIDRATLGLEEQGLAEPVRRAAHGVLEQCLAILVGTTGRKGL